MEASIVEEWLRSLNLVQYTQSFVDNGYDDLEICKQIGELDLDAIGVHTKTHRNDVMLACKRLREQGGTSVYFTLEELNDYQSAAYSSDCDSVSRYSCDKNTDPSSSPSKEVLGEAERLDAYDEGRQALVTFPNIQLSNIVGDILDEQSVHLSEQPYTNVDGTRSPLVDDLAEKYAEQLNTHHLDVLHVMELIRNRRVSQNFENFNSPTSPNAAPPLPSCLPPNTSIYANSTLNRQRSQECSPSRCHGNSMSKPPQRSHTTGNGTDYSEKKKGSGIAKFFRSIGRKSGRKYAYKQHEVSSPLLEEKGDLPASRITMSDDDRIRLMMMVKQGSITMEEAVRAVKQYEEERKVDILEELLKRDREAPGKRTEIQPASPRTALAFFRHTDFRKHSSSSESQPLLRDGSESPRSPPTYHHEEPSFLSAGAHNSPHHLHYTSGLGPSPKWARSRKNSTDSSIGSPLPGRSPLHTFRQNSCDSNQSTPQFGRRKKSSDSGLAISSPQTSPRSASSQSTPSPVFQRTAVVEVHPQYLSRADCGIPSPFLDKRTSHGGRSLRNSTTSSDSSLRIGFRGQRSPVSAKGERSPAHTGTREQRSPSHPGFRCQGSADNKSQLSAHSRSQSETRPSPENGRRAVEPNSPVTQQICTTSAIRRPLTGTSPNHKRSASQGIQPKYVAPPGARSGLKQPEQVARDPVPRTSPRVGTGIPKPATANVRTVHSSPKAERSHKDFFPRQPVQNISDSDVFVIQNSDDILVVTAPKSTQICKSGAVIQRKTKSSEESLSKYSKNWAPDASAQTSSDIQEDFKPTLEVCSNHKKVVAIKRDGGSCEYGERQGVCLDTEQSAYIGNTEKQSDHSDAEHAGRRPSYISVKQNDVITEENNESAIELGSQHEPAPDQNCVSEELVDSQSGNSLQTDVSANHKKGSRESRQTWKDRSQSSSTSPGGDCDTEQTLVGRQNQFGSTSTISVGSESSPPSDRKHAYAMFEKFKKFRLTRSASYSTGDELHSNSSDCEDQDELDRKLGHGNFVRTNAARGSFADRMKGFKKDVRKRISKLRTSKSMGQKTEQPLSDNANDKPDCSQRNEEGMATGGQASHQFRKTPSPVMEEPIYKGPFVGRARVHTSYTPSPYDRDALTLKDGDIVRIISMTQTGTWTGLLNERVGTFKFNLVDLLDETPRFFRRQMSLKKRTHSKRHKPRTVEDLLKRLGLEDLTAVFVLNGYNSLEKFVDIEKEDLDEINIFDPEQRAKILTAAELLVDIDYEDVNASDGKSNSTNPNSPQEPVRMEDDVPPIFQPQLSPDDRLSSPRDSGCYASLEKILPKVKISDRVELSEFVDELCTNIDKECSQRISNVDGESIPDETSPTVVDAVDNNADEDSPDIRKPHSSSMTESVESHISTSSHSSDSAFSSQRVEVVTEDAPINSLAGVLEKEASLACVVSEASLACVVSEASLACVVSGVISPGCVSPISADSAATLEDVFDASSQSSNITTGSSPWDIIEFPPPPRSPKPSPPARSNLTKLSSASRTTSEGQVSTTSKPVTSSGIVPPSRIVPPGSLQKPNTLNTRALGQGHEAVKSPPPVPKRPSLTEKQSPSPENKKQSGIPQFPRKNSLSPGREQTVLPKPGVVKPSSLPQPGLVPRSRLPSPKSPKSPITSPPVIPRRVQSVTPKRDASTQFENSNGQPIQHQGAQRPASQGHEVARPQPQRQLSAPIITTGIPRQTNIPKNVCSGQGIPRPMPNDSVPSSKESVPTVQHSKNRITSKPAGRKSSIPQLYGHSPSEESARLSSMNTVSNIARPKTVPQSPISQKTTKQGLTTPTSEKLGPSPSGIPTNCFKTKPMERQQRQIPTPGASPGTRPSGIPSPRSPRTQFGYPCQTTSPRGFPVTNAIEQAILAKVEEEMINLTAEPYTKKSGCCGIPPALVHRYSEELQGDVSTVSRALEQVRSRLASDKGLTVIPSDALSELCKAKTVDINTSSLTDFLTSLGLPMYLESLIGHDYNTLESVKDMNETDLRILCGIQDPRHLHKLLQAISLMNSKVNRAHHPVIGSRSVRRTAVRDRV